MSNRRTASHRCARDHVWRTTRPREAPAPTRLASPLLALALTLATAATAMAQDDTPVAEAPVPRPEATATAEAPGVPHVLRITPKLGALIPRGDLKTAMVSLLALDIVLPLDPTGANPWLADRLRVVLEGGYALLSQQGEAIVPGRGFTNLIQNSHTFPLRIGLNYLFPQSWTLRPYVGLGYTALITRTTFDLGWTTEDQNDVASGIAFSLGGETSFDLGEDVLGVLVLEVQHTEAGADLGGLGAAGESTLSSTAVLVGFGVEL